MPQLSPMLHTDLGFLLDEYMFKDPADRTAGTTIIILGGILVLIGIGLSIVSDPMLFLLVVAGVIVFVWGCIIWLLSFREYEVRVLLYVDGFVYQTSRKTTTVRWEEIAEGVKLYSDSHNQLWLQRLKLTNGTQLAFNRRAERGTELTKALLIGYYRQQGINWDSGLEHLIE